MVVISLMAVMIGLEVVWLLELVLSSSSSSSSVEEVNENLSFVVSSTGGKSSW